MSAPLAEVDPDIAELLAKELGRQRDTLEMIASENFAPRAVLQAQGSVLTNKYAEGLPGRRYYGGCEHVDVVENLARDRAKALFGAEFANVQPHSGAQANAAVLHALMSPGERLLGLDLANGGHLTHGMRLNFSGKLYENGFYGVDPATHLIDMDAVRATALEFRPKVIIAGWSAYPRVLDFAAFRSIADEVGAKLLVDMAHFAGLVAAGLHPSPVPHADVVSTTVHKTLGGGRSGLIVGKQQYAKAINSAVFPGQQGGPLMHVIAGKAVALKIAATPEFADRQRRTLSGARIIADRLMAPDVAKAGVSVVSGGTDVHLVLVDLRDSPLDGQAAEDLLHEVGITVNRNAVPNDPRPPMVTSGLRIARPRWRPAASATPSSPRSPTLLRPRWRPAVPLMCRRLRIGRPGWPGRFRSTTGSRSGVWSAADAGLSLARISARAPITARHGGARFHEICVCELQLPHGTETCR